MSSFPIAVRILLTVCFLGLLALASLIPGHYEPGDSRFVWLAEQTPTLLQKTLHICLYAVLAFLLVWTLEYIESKTIRYLASVVIAIAFGVLMEWGQTMVSGRFGGIVDVGLNSVGATLGLLIAIFVL